MADRLVLVASNIGVGNAAASSSAVYSLTPGLTSLHITKDAGALANLKVHSLESTLFATDTFAASAIQSNSITTNALSIEGLISANALSVSDTATVGGANVFRVAAGNVVLGNDTFVQSGTNTISATKVVGRSNVDTGTLTANTVIANGVNVLSAIEDVMKSSIRYYVKTTGDDANSGRSWDSAFRTIEKAASVAGSFSTIYVESGDYVIANPIHLKPKVAVIGDNLRNTRLFPQNPKLHMFFVDSLCYLAGLRFMNHRRPSFCVAFACCIAEAITQNQKISAINVLYSPTGYTNVPPEVIIEAPDNEYGRAPTAEATRDGLGRVTSITLVTSGDLYPGTTPTVTIGEPQLSAGIQPSVTASISGGSVNGFTIESTGTPYLTAPEVSITAPASGVQATAIATIDLDSGYLNGITLQEPGSGYTVAPSVSVNPPPKIQATATVTMNFQTDNNGKVVGSPTGFVITNPGSGYSSAPTVTIDAPESIQATAQANVVNGIIDKVTVTNPGSGYTNVFARSHVSIPPPLSKQAFITGSPYIQNCSSITGPFDRQGTLLTVLPPYSLDVYDVDETGAGGGCLIDGFVTNEYSPLRSMVADSFTQINQGGPGHLIINLGYAQFVSCFTTFCSYSYRSVGGGTTNISTSVTDFGTWGLVASGYWSTPIVTGTVSQTYRSEVASVTIPSGKGGSGYTSAPTVVFSSGTATATATLFGDRVESVQVTNGGSYEETPTVSFVGGNGSGAEGTVNMTNPSPITITNAVSANGERKPDLGSVIRHRGVWHTVIGAAYKSPGEYDITLYPGVFAANPSDEWEFYTGSTVSTGQHVMEYAGSGTTYNSLVEYGGQPNPGNQISERFPGRVFYCLTDQSGNQTIGKYFAVEQLTGAVTLNTDKFSLSGLEAIGPFKRNGNPAGVRLEEVSNDPGLQNSLGVVGATTVPTQYAVREYVRPRSIPGAGNAGEAIVKNSDQDYNVSWIPVVLESEKAQPLGVANLDSAGRIIGDGSLISNTDASSLLLGTVSQLRLPITLGNTATQFVGNGVGISHINASNVLTGTLPPSVMPVTIGTTSTQLLGNGVGISHINASNVLTGTLQQAVLPVTLGNAATQFVGNGVAISHISASNVSTGTLPSSVLPQVIGTETTALIGNGAGVSSLNGSNVNTGLVSMNHVGSGTPTGFGNVVLSANPNLEGGMTITGMVPSITLHDTNHCSSFIQCNANAMTFLRGGVNATSATQVNGQWPMTLNLTNNDCTVGGNLSAVQDVIAYASDERLKTNLRPISLHPLEDLDQIRGVRFEWNPDTPQPFVGTDCGLVAQDVARILPEAIKPAPFDLSTDGTSISGNEYMTIDSGNKVTALLVECIKELHDRVKALERQN